MQMRKFIRMRTFKLIVRNFALTFFQWTDV